MHKTIAFLLASASLLAVPILAHAEGGGADLTFPVPELGNCANKAACIAYCDDTAHEDACLDFARAHHLGAYADDSPQVQYPVTELGNCANEKDCRTYCEEPANQATCVDFAERHHLMTAEELAQARAGQLQIGQGHGPGGCNKEHTCEEYCGQLDHVKECVDFAERNGFISHEEAAKARAMGGAGPGNCTSAAACQAYCQDFQHMQECVDFAEAHGLMDADKIAQARKIIAAGGPPAGCQRGEDECRAWCQEAANRLTCIEFAHKMGMISDSDYETGKRMASGSGPGGCTDQATCSAYCSNEDHIDECYAFFHQGQAPPPMPQECKDKGYTRSQCTQMMMPPACKDQGLSPQDCQTYCQSHDNACRGGTNSGSGSNAGGCGGGAGYTNSGCQGIPQACKDKDYDGNQCQQYCQSNPGACGAGQDSGSTSGSGAPGGQGGCGGSAGYSNPGCEGMPQACKDHNFDGNQCQQYCQSNPQYCGWGPGGGSQGGSQFGQSTGQGGSSGQSSSPSGGGSQTGGESGTQSGSSSAPPM
jgi:hypothetical protein